MVKLLVSKTGARMAIVSDDHCPPHVHARHREEGWVVRLWFSFVSSAVGVMDIAPTERAVRQWQLNQMLDEIGAKLSACRQIWWEGKATTCLENRFLVRAKSGEMAFSWALAESAKQVGSAQYNVSGQQTIVVFTDGTEARIGTEGTE